MSTVILDTITGKSTATTITIGSTPVVSASANSMTIRGEGTAQTSIQQGLCKCWGLDNEGANPDTDSFNLASSTDNSTGNYTKTFTNGFAAGDRYCVVGTSNENNYSTVFVSAKAAGSTTIKNENISGAAQDNTTGYQIDGDLA
jgi:hypothetical protein